MFTYEARRVMCHTAVILLIASIAHASGNTSTNLRWWFSQDPVPEVPLTLRANGFDPAEVRPQCGHFVLSIDNRSGVADLVLQLKKADGTQVRELHVSGAGGDWSETLDLAAGTYTLSEANHSSWLCTIIVQ